MTGSLAVHLWICVFTYLPVHKCESTRTTVTSQITGNSQGIPLHRMHSFATFSRDPAAKKHHSIFISPTRIYSGLKEKGHYTSYLITEGEVYRFAITTHTVQHACFDSISTHCFVTKLTGTPVCRDT